MSISRTLSVSAALVLAAITVTNVACSKKEHPDCPPTKVTLDKGWEHYDAKYGSESVLIPTGAYHALIPLDEKSIGERWSNDKYNMYYKFDTIQTSRSVEKSPYVYDLLVCSENIGGHDATVTTLNATGSTLTGTLAQAEWVLPHGHSFYMSVIAAPGTPRDSMVAILKGVKFK